MLIFGEALEYPQFLRYIQIKAIKFIEIGSSYKGKLSPEIMASPSSSVTDPEKGESQSHKP